MQSDKNRLKSAEDLLPETDSVTSGPALSMQAQSLLGLLDELKGTGSGSVLYSQLERILRENEQDFDEREQLYRYWLRLFLGGYIRHLKPGSSMHIHAKLIYKQLQLPLTTTTLKGLRKHMNMFSMHLARLDMLDESVLKNTLEPVLSYYASDEVFDSTVQNSDLISREQTTALEPEPGFNEKTDSVRAQKRALEGMIDDLLPDEGRGTEERLTSTYRQYLSSQYRDTEKVQSMLSKHINETIEQNQKFGDMLHVVRQGLDEAESINEIDVLRQCLIEDIDSLSESHDSMAEKLAETKDYLKMIEVDSRKLSDELARVRLLSMTDELTELPNRRAFLRRLDDEMSRTKRYGADLALVIIDLDHFKTINDKYGHAVGDAVLCSYAEDILTTFRHHDMVARYGGEEFAVLLPNTDEQGAMAALHKVRRQAASQFCGSNGNKIQAPTFSAGLALFIPGESASGFIQRADDALYTAKRLGRNRIEVSHSSGNIIANEHEEEASDIV
ncbi:MAG: GGDEF domain-containing protein [Gammaproteobacteria bacterium]|nr:GGDEF domain-containing protein [Gammaproteobacteria bacterium]